MHVPLVERVERIELSNSPWQGLRLPLHHTRILLLILWWIRKDSNLRTQRGEIYSLLVLATHPPIHCIVKYTSI